MKSITIYNMEEEYPAAAQLIEEIFRRRKLSRVVRTETMMIF